MFKPDFLLRGGPCAVTNFLSLYLSLPVIFWTVTRVGITLCSTKRNIFARHYELQSVEVRTKGNYIFSVEKHIGSKIPPNVGRTLFCARIDPYLVSGCDVSLDVDGNINALIKEQLPILRRILGLSGHSMIAPLYTELGILPLKY